MDRNSRSQTAMESVWSVSKLSTESVGSRRELVANCVHTADADAIGRNSTVESCRRRRCVLGNRVQLCAMQISRPVNAAATAAVSAVACNDVVLYCR